MLSGRGSSGDQHPSRIRRDDADPVGFPDLQWSRLTFVCSSVAATAFAATGALPRRRTCRGCGAAAPACW